MQGLRDFLHARGALVDLEGYDDSHLDLRSEEALRLLRAGDPAWEPMRSGSVAELIKERALIGHH